MISVKRSGFTPAKASPLVLPRVPPLASVSEVCTSESHASSSRIGASMQFLDRQSRTPRTLSR
eukprot:6006025-Amphidinium_carterae.1